MDIDAVTPFNVRILAIWSGIGASIFLILGVVGLTSGSWTDGNIAMLIPLLIFGAFAYNVYGLFILFLVAGTQYRFKFNEIHHPVWYWAMYPIIGMVILSFAFIWQIFKSAFRIS
ncbi:hypothetical protein [Limnothrix redekei]|uniref:Uncharacterized protein n=1 Tax=Limnothrix redekei LRLZ20PSL1 TaxID=3112953 RepID=A0ABW7CA82_9CYAN